MQLAPTYADLQNVSDIVVKATVIPGKENKLITADDGTVVFGYTITQLNVTEVFKGNGEGVDTTGWKELKNTKACNSGTIQATTARCIFDGFHEIQTTSTSSMGSAQTTASYN